MALQLSKYVDLSKVGWNRRSMILPGGFPGTHCEKLPFGIRYTVYQCACQGGYGYCQDFPVEQHFRDIRIDPIHEGTTGIQAQDLLGGKTTMKKGEAYRLFMAEVNPDHCRGPRDPGTQNPGRNTCQRVGGHE